MIRVGGCSGVAGHRVRKSCVNRVNRHITGDGVDGYGQWGVVGKETEAKGLVDLTGLNATEPGVIFTQTKGKKVEVTRLMLV